MRASYVANPNLAPGLLPYDLTRGGSPFHFNGTGAIKQQAAFVQDEIARSEWTFNLGLRFDRYDGSVPPRCGSRGSARPTG